jgi:hypothetical protein
VTVGAPKQAGLVEESIAARPTNLIVSAWQAATDELRRYFVHVYYDALATIVEQIAAEAPAEAADGEPPLLDLRERAGVAP